MARACFPQPLLGPARTCLGPTGSCGTTSWWVPARFHSETCGGAVFFALSWFVAPMAQPAAECSTPQHRVSCPKRARGCAELGWTSGSQLTQFTVHSSQFTRRLREDLVANVRLFPVVYLTNLANVAPAGTSRRRRPRLLLVGATQGPPLQSMVQQQDVLSCLSAERTSEYYSNGCARVWHLPRSIAAADGAISRALLFCLLG